jgi:thiol-disulfide isomerase/thioredoxin
MNPSSQPLKTVIWAAVAALLLAFGFVHQTALAANAPRLFDSANWRTLASSHNGRPLIVHFWGFTCGNCMVELNDWGKFAKAHPGVAIAFVNWDRRGADPSRIAQALDKAGLGGVQSFVLANGFEEKLRFAVDHDWMGELPYTRLIAGDGTATTFSGTADFKKLSQWLEAESHSAH